MKRILSMLFLALILLAIQPLIAPAHETVSVSVNGLALESDIQPIIQNGRTLIPLQAIAKAMDIVISWNDQTRIVNATDGSTTVRLQIDNRTAYRNNSSIILDVAPQIENGHFLIPLRFFAESFNYQVNWDSTLYQVSILSPPSTMTDIIPTEVTPIIPPAGSPPPLPISAQGQYVGDIDSNKYHLPVCIYAKQIEWANEIWFKSKTEAEEAHYVPCEVCCSAR